MKKRFTEEQIVKILQDHANGKNVKEVARDNGVSENTIYIWKKKFGGMTVPEVKRLKALEEENSRLKHLVAELSLDNRAQKDIIKKYCSPN